MSSALETKKLSEVIRVLIDKGNPKARMYLMCLRNSWRTGCLEWNGHSGEEPWGREKVRWCRSCGERFYPSMLGPWKSSWIEFMGSLSLNGKKIGHLCFP